jgi:GAF domain-containing protein
MEETRGTPLEWSFCTNVVVTGDEFVVQDATRHPSVRHIPLVEEEDVRSYAGIPLRTTKGQVVGSFCVIGDRPHDFTDDDLAALRTLAARAMERIEQRRRAT